MSVRGKTLFSAGRDQGSGSEESREGKTVGSSDQKVGTSWGSACIHDAGLMPGAGVSAVVD